MSTHISNKPVHIVPMTLGKYTHVRHQKLHLGEDSAARGYRIISLRGTSHEHSTWMTCAQFEHHYKRSVESVDEASGD